MRVDLAHPRRSPRRTAVDTGQAAGADGRRGGDGPDRRRRAQRPPTVSQRVQRGGAASRAVRGLSRHLGRRVGQGR